MKEKNQQKRTPRLQLEELKVQSFVTELKPEVAQTAKGGDDSTSEIVSAIVTKSLDNSGNSKWPCRFACKTKQTTTTTGGGGNPSSDPI
ncbi:MAG TPA: pinensin family lanthipeptide [Chitinophaga sp.]|uniref:pinensin family lanthipeptide n=1 Tax=Chitinophaga sp. TaxID=1869181 RepID=UPI002C96380B|nr:pinensin family lanthipeptide [Chitinophaga sp.]HVI45576.1 pinensin family lanthipeptide [Chitinophaga sp.]